jgi:hypothetical protein
LDIKLRKSKRCRLLKGSSVEIKRIQSDKRSEIDAYLKRTRLKKI